MRTRSEHGSARRAPWLALLLGVALVITGARAEEDTLGQTTDEGVVLPLVLTPCRPDGPPISDTDGFREVGIRLGIRPVITDDDSQIHLAIDLDLATVPEGTPVTVGIDVRGTETRVTTATPPMVPGGATFGTAATFVRGDTDRLVSSAVVATEAGDVYLASRARLRMSGGPAHYEILFPLADFPAGMDRMRPTFVFGTEICGLVGDPTVDDGYLSAASLLDELQRRFDELDRLYRCSATFRACLMLPRGLPVTSTGDGTFDVVFEGSNFSVQFYTFGGRSDDILTGFRNAGWMLADPTAIATSFLAWQVFAMLSGGDTLGTLSVSDNGSSTDPVAFAVVITSLDALTGMRRSAMDELRRMLLGGFNSAFEALP